jgi:hypothetical protein
MTREERIAQLRSQVRSASYLTEEVPAGPAFVAGTATRQDYRALPKMQVEPEIPDDGRVPGCECYTPGIRCCQASEHYIRNTAGAYMRDLREEDEQNAEIRRLFAPEIRVLQERQAVAKQLVAAPQVVTQPVPMTEEHRAALDSLAYALDNVVAASEDETTKT